MGVARAQAAADAPAADAGAWRFAGYEKLLMISSRTSDPSGENYALALNRVRLKLDYVDRSRFELHLENDTELRAGDYLSTAQFQAEEQLPTRRYVDLESTWARGHDYRLTNDFFRAYAKLSWRDTDAWFGRQRIPLGTGRLWSTVDALNPQNPLTIERDEYVGVDAVMVEQRLGALSKAALVYSPEPGGGSARWAARWRTHRGETDIGATLARYWDDQLFGADIATQLGGLGLHGELTVTRPRIGTRYLSAVLGLDYAFENTLSFSFEAYASSQPSSARLAEVAADPLRAQVQPLGRRYAGLVTSYEFTPLLKGTLVLLANLGDHSRFASASLAYSLSENLVLQGGTQQFGGRGDSEYGRGRPLAYLQLQWYF